MNELKSTKYMKIFSALGYAIGFGLIIWCSIFQNNAVFPIVGVIVIFIGRFIGYGLDRIVELKEDKKKN